MLIESLKLDDKTSSSQDTFKSLAVGDVVYVRNHGSTVYTVYELVNSGAEGETDYYWLSDGINLHLANPSSVLLNRRINKR